MIGGILVAIGSVFLALAMIGIVRFDDPLMRLQAASKGATGGLGLILMGAFCLDPKIQTLAYSIAMFTLVLIVNPTTSHLIASSYIDDDGELSTSMDINELEGKSE